MYDPDARTVRIPVIIRNGNLEFQSTGSLADLKDGAHGELIVDAFTIRDENLRNELLQETTLCILPTNSTLYFHMNPANTPDHLRQYLIHLPHAPHSGPYIKALLQAPLELRLRGTKAATLESCPCLIPALGVTAASVNHAYSLISLAFEPKRRSHTANVFDKVVYFDQQGHVRKLEHLRQNLPSREAAAEDNSMHRHSSEDITLWPNVL